MHRLIGILIFLFVFVAAALAADAPKKSAVSPLVERGKYLVAIGSCNDCHTPWKMGPRGPEADRTRMLMGHPQGVKLAAPALPLGPWDTATGGMTAWAGPWGVSYAANLTPDKNTGVGSWNETMFVEAIQTGRHWGKGRPILPPMPWQNLSQAKVEDLKAIFSYLQSIPAIANRVPDPAINRGK